MLVKGCSTFVAMFMVFLWADDASSAAAPNPECPWVKPGNSWVDFILGRVPYSGKKLPSYVFSVRFENMGSIKDSKRFTGRKRSAGNNLGRIVLYSFFQQRPMGSIRL